MGARRSALLFVSILLALIGTLFVTPPAFAAECVPDKETACVQGTIKLSTGEPAVGITLDLVGGDEDLSAVTDDAGEWSFTVLESGEFDVTVDESTLPEGQFLKSLGTRTVQAELHDSASALFPLTDDESAAGGADAPAADASDKPAAESASAFSWPRFWQQFVSGLRLGLLIALASLGLSLIFGTTGLSNFAQGELVSMGGILAWAFMTITGNLWLSGLIAVLAMALFGYLQDTFLWRPLRKRRLSLMQMMIVSIGLSIALQYTFQLLVGSGVLRIDTSASQTVTFFGVTLTVQSYIAMAIAGVAIAAVGLGLKFTRFGRATRAVSDNPALAEASGINVDSVIRLVWIVGVALAGLSGVLLGLVLNGISWFTGGQMLLLFFAAVILGGIGTAFGAFVGAMIIGLIVEMSNIWLPGDLKYAAALFILIVILLVRPQGIFGRKERIG